MSSYIDADALDNRIKAEWAKQEDDKGYGLAHFLVETQPTADVAPVVHAHWVRTRLCNECSLCRGGWLGLPETKFCPNCGAKMDEEVKQ